MGNLKLTILLGFDGLIGLALAAMIGVAVVGGVETFDSELETRREAVPVLEPGAMVFSWSVTCRYRRNFCTVIGFLSYLCLLNCDARRLRGVNDRWEVWLVPL